MFHFILFQGLIPRAKLLLTIGGTFFLGFGPLILITVAFFCALYFVSSLFSTLVCFISLNLVIVVGQFMSFSGCIPSLQEPVLAVILLPSDCSMLFGFSFP